MAREGRRKAKKVATAEAILRHIGQEHFADQRLFNLDYQLCKNGEWYHISYDWVYYESDYEGGIIGSSYASPSVTIAERHAGVTRRGDPRKFSVKPMINVLGFPLTDWEARGTMSLYFLLTINARRA